MTRAAALVLLSATLAACAHRPPLAIAKGPYRPLNVGKWTATHDDLRGPRAPLPPAQSPMLAPPPMPTPTAAPTAESSS